MCPGCGAAGDAPDERFCRRCGLPLVHATAAEEPVSEARARARKIRPQYSEGPLVRAAWARNQAEAELIQGLLIEEGVPSMVKRTRGFDVPDFLAAGPRDIFVPASGADAAREVLSSADVPAPAPGRPPSRVWVQAMAVALVVLLLAASAAGVLAVLAP